MRLFGKIGRRLLAWFLLVALIPLLFMGYQGYYFARRAVEDEVFRHMETVAKSKQLAIEQWFQERRHDVEMLTVSVTQQSGLRPDEDIRALLYSFQKQSPAYAVLAVEIPREAAIVVPDGADPEQGRTQGINEPDWVRIAPLGLYVSPIYLNPSFGAAINFEMPIRNGSGTRIGSMHATITLSNTLNPIILDTTGLGHTGQAYLVDEKKVMLTPSRFMNHPAPLSHTMDTEGIRRALAGGSGSGVYRGFEGHGSHGDFAGQQVLGAWAYLPEQKWALIAEMNADEAFAPLATLRRDAFLVAIATMGAILVVVAWVSRSISLPIRQLADASLDVSRGNLDRTVAVNVHDEVGDLAARFNQMVQSLRESQRQLVQSERLAAIGELVASVVHEIRNPLSSVKMNLRILESKCATDPVTVEHFKLARTQTERLESMLSELLDYSKPIVLQKQTVHPEELIQEALACLRDDPVPMNTRIANGLPLLKVDKERMVQVLLNLLINARQAVDSSGLIEVEAEKSADNHVTLTVRDNGQGIPEGNLRHIFEPFFTTRKQGTGLGLPNARKIVEAHGGQIHISSEPNHGTEAKIELPVS